MQHYNYLFIGEKHCELTLLNEQMFLQIVEILRPLLAYIDTKKCKIGTYQHLNGQQVKFGRLRWASESLVLFFESHKNIKDNDKLYSNFFTAEFPSIDAAYKRAESVEIYIHIENDSFYGRAKSDGDCGLFLSIREDIYDRAGEMVVKQTIRELYMLFDKCKVLFHKRTWWCYDNVEKIGNATVSVQAKNEEGALQDVAPYRAIDKLYSKYYKYWTEYTL